MSRMKVSEKGRKKHLTRTGRQVSEDPDLDNLLSTLSPEEMEQLSNDIEPDIAQRDSQPVQPSTSNNVCAAKQESRQESDLKGRLSQREQSFEVCKFFT